MLLGTLSLWPPPPPPPNVLYPSVGGGVAVIFQVGAHYVMETPGGTMKAANPQNLIRAAKRMGMTPSVE